MRVKDAALTESIFFFLSWKELLRCFAPSGAHLRGFGAWPTF
jgi:hypothetical protein